MPGLCHSSVFAQEGPKDLSSELLLKWAWWGVPAEAGHGGTCDLCPYLSYLVVTSLHPVFPVHFTLLSASSKSV